MKAIEEYASRGWHQDEMEALQRITRAYISQCGISRGYRTVLYAAGEAWQERLAWKDLPLSEMARKLALVELMPLISVEYDPALYDKYDITGMSNEELFDGCQKILSEGIMDESTKEVLCWGLLKAIEEKKELSQEIMAIDSDGTPLKGILLEQRCAVTLIKMASPYNNVYAMQDELVREASQLLIDLYEDYNRLHNMEGEVRALYPKYQEELKKHIKDSPMKKAHVFGDIYGNLIGKTVIQTPQDLFQEWFGLEFYGHVLVRIQSVLGEQVAEIVFRSGTLTGRVYSLSFQPFPGRVCGGMINIRCRVYAQHAQRRYGGHLDLTFGLVVENAGKIGRRYQDVQFALDHQRGKLVSAAGDGGNILVFGLVLLRVCEQLHQAYGGGAGEGTYSYRDRLFGSRLGVVRLVIIVRGAAGKARDNE